MLLTAIVPTRNRGQRVSDLLNSFAGQDAVSFEWEVLVVDNGSTDNAKELITAAINKLNIQVRYILEPRLGLHHARHRGIIEAKGQFVGFLDDDMLLAPTWIQGVLALQQDKAHAVVGKIPPKWEGIPAPWLMQIVKSGTYPPLSILDLGTEQKYVDPLHVWGCNCFMPRQLILNLGGFNPDITALTSEEQKFIGDGETGLMMKFIEADYRALYDPQAAAFHIVSAERVTADYLCQRYFRQGICDSYTALRVQHGLIKTQSVHDGMKSSAQYLRELALGKFFQLLMRRVKKMSRWLSDPERARLEARFFAAYREGYKYHQAEAASDPELMAYVTRPSYLE